MRTMEKARGRGTPLTPLSLLFFCVLLGSCPSAFALNPDLDISQYAHRSWKINDGFTKSDIISIAQTPDGYLWLGTELGLFRFNGVRNVPWRPPGDQNLPSNWIFSLLASHDGTLWIGTEKGLASWKDGKLIQHAELAGQTIFKLLEDHEGTIWASGLTVNTGRLCAIQDARVQCFGDDGSLGRGAFNLYEDSKGNLWAGVRDGLWRWRPGPPKFYFLAGEPDGIQCLGEDNDGTLLVGWNGGIHRFVDGKTEPYSPLGTARQLRARRLLRDRDGGLWIGTFNQGLLHVHKGRTDVFTPSDGLTSERVNALVEDREGNIWVATRSGLDHFSDFAVATFSKNQGLSSSIVQSVLADNDGSVWLAASDRLNRWNRGQFTTLGSHGERNDKRAALRPNSLFQDNSGRVWVSTPFGFGYLNNDRFVSVSSLPGAVTAIAQDTAGDLWIANENVGLFQVLPGDVVQQIPWSRFGHNDHVSALAADPLRGGLWLGFFLGGVAYFSEGEIRASYGAGTGLTGGRVSDFQFDKDGALWIAAEGGLSRVKDRRITTLTSKNGLPCDAVHWLREDEARSFWLYTACGLVRIARSEFDKWAAAVDLDLNAKPTIQATVFDSSDGVRGLASGIHFSPQVAKSTDGKLWFSTGDGVSVINPTHLPFNKLPPPVHIEQIIADRKTYDSISDTSEPLQLPALIRDLQIDYTALSLVAPEKILFRYKLEGRDSDWQEAGTRRQVFYNDLGPGNYRFRVMACNNSGVWNEAGTFLDFYIAPAYYQTTWFRVLVMVAILLALFLIYQLRLQQVARQVRARMQERLDERERIARDLHDTLLQSVQGLILTFDAGVQQIPADVPARETMEKALDYADEVLGEGRDRVRNLRANTIPINGLPLAFQRVAEETLQRHDMTFKTVVEGSVQALHPMVMEESYCIGREALINALSHSGGAHVEVEITYDPRQFRLRVRDDGGGVDPKILKEGSRPDHWGLKGMQERAERIGGQLNLWSRPITGTEVELTVPGATAYQASEAKSKNFWSRWFARGDGEYQ